MHLFNLQRYRAAIQQLINKQNKNHPDSVLIDVEKGKFSVYGLFPDVNEITSLFVMLSPILDDTNVGKNIKIFMINE